MTCEKIKSLLSYAVHITSSVIGEFTHDPGDFTRDRKLPAPKLLTFLISQGSSGTRNELLDFFDMKPDLPTASALNQQRAKLMPDALKTVFGHFNNFLLKEEDSSQYPKDYRFLAADGSSFTFFSRPKWASPEYFVSEGHSAKGFYSMHLNALYDLNRCTYTNAVIQPVHYKDEFQAFCEMVDQQENLPRTKNVFIGDRGYCSYNNMAHVIEKGQFFLFRTKDIFSKGLAGNFEFPTEDSFDISVNVTLVRSHSSKIKVKDSFYKRFVDKNTTFDFLEYGSMDSYDLSFRIVRFQLQDGSFECLVTNLPKDEFPPRRLKELYCARWGLESSFRQLKYTIGLSNFHAYKPEFIIQEIWAKLIAYNLTETVIKNTVVEHGETKHEYKINFSRAAHICRVFLRPYTKKDHIDVTSLLLKELIPIRDDRHYPRLKTAHFRRPRYFTYRAA